MSDMPAGYDAWRTGSYEEDADEHEARDRRDSDRDDRADDLYDRWRDERDEGRD